MKQMVLFQTILNVKKSLKNNDLSLKMFAFLALFKRIVDLIIIVFLTILKLFYVSFLK